MCEGAEKERRGRGDGRVVVYTSSLVVVVALEGLLILTELSLAESKSYLGEPRHNGTTHRSVYMCIVVTFSSRHRVEG